MTARPVLVILVWVVCLSLAREYTPGLVLPLAVGLLVFAGVLLYREARRPKHSTGSRGCEPRLTAPTPSVIASLAHR